MAIEYNSVPVGSFIDQPAEARVYYWQKIFMLPETARKMLVNVNTGAGIRGICRNYGFPLAQSQQIALVVLRLAIGEMKFSQLAGFLSANMTLPNDKAQRMAREIEQDFFGPVRQELEAHWAKDKKEKPATLAQAKAEQSGANNVLNLKKESQPPVPPWRNLQNK